MKTMSADTHRQALHLSPIIFRTMSNESHPTTVWASGNDNTWGTLKHGFTGITSYYSKLSEKGGSWVCVKQVELEWYRV